MFGLTDTLAGRRISQGFNQFQEPDQAGLTQPKPTEPDVSAFRSLAPVNAPAPTPQAAEPTFLEKLSDTIASEQFGGWAAGLAMGKTWQESAALGFKGMTAGLKADEKRAFEQKVQAEEERVKQALTQSPEVVQKTMQMFKVSEEGAKSLLMSKSRDNILNQIAKEGAELRNAAPSRMVQKRLGDGTVQDQYWMPGQGWVDHGEAYNPNATKTSSYQMKSMPVPEMPGYKANYVFNPATGQMQMVGQPYPVSDTGQTTSATNTDLQKSRRDRIELRTGLDLFANHIEKNKDKMWHPASGLIDWAIGKADSSGLREAMQSSGFAPKEWFEAKDARVQATLMQEKIFNPYRKLITGAAAAQQELANLKDGFINFEKGYVPTMQQIASIRAWLDAADHAEAQMKEFYRQRTGRTLGPNEDIPESFTLQPGYGQKFDEFFLQKYSVTKPASTFGTSNTPGVFTPSSGGGH